jgi:hypothetical protein
MSLKPKTRETVCLKGKLAEREVLERTFEAESDHKIAQLDDNLCRLKQNIEEEATKRAAELQAGFEKRLSDELTDYHMRTKNLEKRE